MPSASLGTVQSRCACRAVVHDNCAESVQGDGRFVVVLQSRGLPPFKWFIAEFCGSGCDEEAATKEIQLCSTVHKPLQQFETVDLPFGLSATPGQLQCGVNRGAILIQAGREAFDDACPASFRLVEPVIASFGGLLGPCMPDAAATSDKAAEPAIKVDHFGGFVVMKDPRHGGGCLDAEDIGFVSAHWSGGISRASRRAERLRSAARRLTVLGSGHWGCFGQGRACENEPTAETPMRAMRETG